MVTKTPKEKASQDLISVKASSNCGIEKFVLSPPSWSLANRNAATSRSRGVKNQAVSGPLGMAKKNTTPIAEVKAPQIRNNILHGAREKVVFLPMPLMRRSACESREAKVGNGAL
jgi:hypothetical protein